MTTLVEQRGRVAGSITAYHPKLSLAVQSRISISLCTVWKLALHACKEDDDEVYEINYMHTKPIGQGYPNFFSSLP